MKVSSNHWHKSFHDAELVECHKLTASERGCIYTLRNLIFRDMGHVANDDVTLAGECGVRPDRFRLIKAKLLHMNLLYKSGTSLRSAICDDAINERLSKREKAVLAGRKGGSSPKTRRKSAGQIENAKTSLSRDRAESGPDLFDESTAYKSESYPRTQSAVDSLQILHEHGKKTSLKANETVTQVEANASKVESILRSKKEEEEGSPSDSHVDGDENDAAGLVASAVDEAVSIFNDMAGNGNDWAKVNATSLAPKRRARLAKVLTFKGTGGVTGWRAMLERASASDFLAGRTRRSGDHASWRASIDYFARIEVFFEVTEGQRDNKPAPASGNHLGKPKGASAVGKALVALAKVGAGGPD